MTSLSDTLYIGLTNKLQRRVYEHKQGLIESSPTLKHRAERAKDVKTP